MTTRAYSDNNLYLTLDSPNYTLAMASRLTKLSKDRVRRWLQGYKYKYEVAGGDEVREGRQDALVFGQSTRERTYASFLDLVDMLFVKKFLEHNIPLQTIRKALDEARNILRTQHFATKKFFTDGSNIYLLVYDESSGCDNIIALMTGGQYAISKIIVELSHKIEFDDVIEYATRWYPLGKNGRIVIDPRISFGRPTIIGRGIATESIYNWYLGENEKIDSVSNWLNVPPSEVQAAVNFEYGLHE